MDPGESRQERLLHTAALGLPDGQLVGRPRAENAEIFGQHHEPRALGRRLADQRLRLRQIRRDVAAGNGLHGGDAQALTGFRHRAAPGVDSAPAPGAALALSPAFLVTTGSDQLPVTVYS